MFCACAVGDREPCGECQLRDGDEYRVYEGYAVHQDRIAPFDLQLERSQESDSNRHATLPYRIQREVQRETLNQRPIASVPRRQHIHPDHGQMLGQDENPPPLQPLHALALQHLTINRPNLLALNNLHLITKRPILHHNIKRPIRVHDNESDLFHCAA